MNAGEAFLSALDLYLDARDEVLRLDNLIDGERDGEVRAELGRQRLDASRTCRLAGKGLTDAFDAAVSLQAPSDGGTE